MSDKYCTCNYEDCDEYQAFCQYVTELESQLADARAEIAGLREECTGLRQALRA